MLKICTKRWGNMLKNSRSYRLYEHSTYIFRCNSIPFIKKSSIKFKFILNIHRLILKFSFLLEDEHQYNKFILISICRHYGNTHGKSNILTSGDLTSFMYQVARGMDYLTSRGVNKFCRIFF